MVDDPITRLLRVAAALEGATGIRTCLVGGLARGVWAPPRATADVDVIVDTEDLQPILDH